MTANVILEPGLEFPRDLETKTAHTLQFGRWERE